MFYLIIGENDLLIEEKVTEICKKFPDTAFNKQKHRPLEDWIEKIESCDLFNPNIGVISIEPKWLKKSTKEIIPKINATCETAKSFNIPNIIITKNIDKRSSIYKLLKKQITTETLCPEFKDWETDKIKQWVSSYTTSQKVTISPAAIDLLIDGYGTQLSIIKQELDKCIIATLPNPKIEIEHIKNSSGTSIGIYSALSESIKLGNVQQIIQNIHSLIQLKEDGHKIFNQFLFQINQLLPIALGLKQKKTSEAIASELGKHPYFIKKLTQTIIKNPIAPKIRNIVILLANIDKDIKSGRLSAKQGLIKLTTTLKYQI